MVYAVMCLFADSNVVAILLDIVKFKPARPSMPVRSLDAAHDAQFARRHMADVIQSTEYVRD